MHKLGSYIAPLPTWVFMCYFVFIKIKHSTVRIQNDAIVLTRRLEVSKRIYCKPVPFCLCGLKLMAMDVTALLLIYTVLCLQVNIGVQPYSRA